MLIMHGLHMVKSQDIYYNVNIRINNNSMQEIKLPFR